MDFVLNAVTGTINAMSTVLVGWTFTRNLGEDMAKITPYMQKANVLVPVDAALNVLALWIGVNLALIAYYWISRTLNLLRGAG